MREVFGCRDRFGKPRIELLGNNQEPRAAVRKHESVIVLGQKRVDRNRDHAGLDGAEESGRPIDGIGEADEDALLAADAERAQRMGKTLHALRKLAVAVAAAMIDEGDLAAAAGVEIALEDIGREIVVARDGVSGRARRQGSAERYSSGVSSPNRRGFAHVLPIVTHYGD